MNASAELLLGVSGERLAALEALQIARRVRSDAGAVSKTVDYLIAGIENRLIERILIGRLRKALKYEGDPAGALRHADQMRNAYDEGHMETLPSFQPSRHVAPGAFGGKFDPDPARQPKPNRPPVTILYVVGGGFLMPPSMQQKLMVQRLAEATDCEVVIGAHRMAPEHPFPAAPTDIAAHYSRLLEEGREAGQIFLAADTAGASVSLGALQLLQQQGIPSPAGIVLFSPWCDLGLSGWSYITSSVTAKSPFRMETAAFCARLYLRDAMATDPLASPIYADQSGWPPILIHTSENDLHFDDAVRLAENAQACGGDVRINYWDSPRHHLERMSSSDAKASFDRVAGFIDERRL